MIDRNELLRAIALRVRTLDNTFATQTFYAQVMSVAGGIGRLSPATGELPIPPMVNALIAAVELLVEACNVELERCTTIAASYVEARALEKLATEPAIYERAAELAMKRFAELAAEQAAAARDAQRCTHDELGGENTRCVLDKDHRADVQHQAADGRVWSVGPPHTCDEENFDPDSTPSCGGCAFIIAQRQPRRAADGSWVYPVGQPAHTCTLSNINGTNTPCVACAVLPFPASVPR